MNTKKMMTCLICSSIVHFVFYRGKSPSCITQPGDSEFLDSNLTKLTKLTSIEFFS